MPRWNPEAKWQGEDVFIIGGGDSLRSFDWELLRNELTIGCNDAYLFGKDICKICVFGDHKWFRKHRDKLEQYKGVVITNCTQLLHTKLEWLWATPRKGKGLGELKLGWNKNTGALAVNLALLLGAKRIYLLGFDMHLSKEGKPNWHDNMINRASVGVYEKFIEAFTRVSIDLKKKFPGREVINVTNNSDLDIFPKIACDVFWEQRKRMKLERIENG